MDGIDGVARFDRQHDGALAPPALQLDAAGDEPSEQAAALAPKVGATAASFIAWPGHRAGEIVVHFHALKSIFKFMSSRSAPAPFVGEGGTNTTA